MGLEAAGMMQKDLLQMIFTQAEQEYPHECCGMILGPQAEKEKLTRVRPCINVQDQYHGLDPKTFPRTAATAYFMDPKELLAIQKEARTAQEEIRIIYHSHVDCGAYFSEEDKRIATADGAPAYPGVHYLVVSVRDGKVADSHLFSWNPEKKDFV